MNTNLKQNVRLAFAAIALLFVCTVASVKAEFAPISSHEDAIGKTAHYSSPLPVCPPEWPSCPQ